MSPGLYRVVGALEVAGAVGLLLGPASAPLGVAAGIGQVPLDPALFTRLRVTEEKFVCRARLRLKAAWLG
nr:DoxX family protein [Streptomyces sp. SKN60]